MFESVACGLQEDDSDMSFDRQPDVNVELKLIFTRSVSFARAHVLMHLRVAAYFRGLVSVITEVDLHLHARLRKMPVPSAYDEIDRDFYVNFDIDQHVHIHTRCNS